ncbi:hypothetical protein CsSME_00011831 [Camellia sinensis var. sinensis]
MAIPISTCILFRLYSQALLMKLTERFKIKIVFLNMQVMVMDGLHPQNVALYVEGHYMGEGQGPYRLGP